MTPTDRRPIDVASLIWGLLLALVASLGLWVGTGHHLNWAVVKLGLPIALIALGLLGLVLSRQAGRTHRKES